MKLRYIYDYNIIHRSDTSFIRKEPIGCIAYNPETNCMGISIKNRKDKIFNKSLAKHMATERAILGVPGTVPNRRIKIYTTGAIISKGNRVFFPYKSVYLTDLIQHISDRLRGYGKI